MYGCESWTMKKAECSRIDAFELWCWRRLLRAPWTARRSNQSISVVLETQTLSLLLPHYMWPWPSWQPPSPRPWGGGRSWLLSLSTDLDLDAWLLLSARESRSRGPPSRLPCAAKIQDLLPQMNESRFRGQPVVSAPCSQFWDFGEWKRSKLCVQYLYLSSFSHWIMSSICKARGSFLVCVCQLCSSL